MQTRIWSISSAACFGRWINGRVKYSYTLQRFRLGTCHITSSKTYMIMQPASLVPNSQREL